MPEEWRQGFVAMDPTVVSALSATLLSHRKAIF